MTPPGLVPKSSPKNDTGSTPPPPSVAARLELAASHKSFSEGVAALEAWLAHSVSVNTAADLPARSTGDIFLASRALDVLLARLIGGEATQDGEVCGPEDSRTEAAPAVTALLQSLFTPVLSAQSGGPASAALSSVGGLISDLVDTANDAIRAGLLRDVATGAAVALAARLAHGVRAVFSSVAASFSANSSDAAKKRCTLLQQCAAMEARVRSEAGKSGMYTNLRALLEHRETAQDLLELHGALRDSEGVSKHADGGVEAGLLRTAAALRQRSDSPNRAAHFSILQEVGEDPQSIQDKERAARASQGQVQKVMAAHETRLGPLKSELGHCAATLQDLEGQQRALESQLAQVKSRVGAAKARKATLEGALKEATSVRDTELQSTSAANRDVVLVLQRAESSRAMVERVSAVEHALAGVATAAAQATKPALLEGMEGVSGGLVSASAATSNGPGSVGAGVASAVMYVRAEAACLTLLSARCVAAQQKLRALRQEAEEFKGLGMKVMAQDIDTTMAKMQTNVQDDVGAVSSILDCLVSALAECPFPLATVISQDRLDLGVAVSEACAAAAAIGVEAPAQLAVLAMVSTTTVKAPKAQATRSVKPAAATTATTTAVAATAAAITAATTTAAAPAATTAASASTAAPATSVLANKTPSSAKATAAPAWGGAGVRKTAE